jgi:hypothetical protein
LKKIKDMSIGELGALVCSHLEENGIRVTLTGGACVSIYTDNRYESMDLDFVEEMPVTRRKLKRALEEIGFTEKSRYFVQPDTEFFLEFPSGPLSVGEEPIGEIVELTFSTGRLRLISPTDCVKDRLAGFFHWNDRQSLEQALLVARDQEIDLVQIQRWSEGEGQRKKFESFFSALSK